MMQQTKRKRRAPPVTAGFGASALTTASARATVDKGLLMARMLASSMRSEESLAFARAMTFTAIEAYWDTAAKKLDEPLMLRDLPATVALAKLSPPTAALAHDIGFAAAALDVQDASYLIGILYTATMPSKERALFGAYYTPPALCERLLDVASEAGVDWRSAHVLDPACGGGAFLSPVALRMLHSLGDCSPKIALKNILYRLRGFELDPFAAWISEVFLEVALYDVCRAAGARLPGVVEVCDSLEREPEGDGFDLVIGNPPYGRTTLPLHLRAKYRRSLYGHANLYGLFTDLALRFSRLGGVIAYVTPTSFLAGEYFKVLRGLLYREAPPVSIDFISERKGVFADVLQETLLAVYRRGDKSGSGLVNYISQNPDGRIDATTAGSFQVPKAPEEPWLVPRAKTHGRLIRNAQQMRYRLVDYGYRVSTGPLVWNRHKPSLRDRSGKGRYPLIWAESIRSDGTFEFRAQKRNHKPYFDRCQRKSGSSPTSHAYSCSALRRRNKHDG